jgi:hypothetical protein
MVTLDELPLLHNGNVAPNVRIVWPRDADPLDAHRIELAGFASDRNSNLESVEVRVLSEPWLNWAGRREDTVRELFASGKYLGEARIGAQGRWTITWEDVPAGYHHLAAFARDTAGAVACSNVVRVTVMIDNLAHGKKATASSKSRWGGPPEDAVDGDPSTQWWADKEAEGPQWLMVDLGTQKRVGAVCVTWWGAYAKDYTVQVSSDGKDWREAARVEDRHKPAGDSDLLRFAPVKGRYVRLYCTQPAVDWQHYCVYEFAIYEGVPE